MRRQLPEEIFKTGLPFFIAFFPEPVQHRQLIKIGEQGHIFPLQPVDCCLRHSALLPISSSVTISTPAARNSFKAFSTVPGGESTPRQALATTNVRKPAFKASRAVAFTQ